MKRNIRISLLFLVALGLLGRCSDQNGDLSRVVKSDPVPKQVLNESDENSGGRTAATCGGSASGTKGGFGYYTYPDVVINVTLPGTNLVRNGSFETRKPGTNCPVGPWQNQPTQGFPEFWAAGMRGPSSVSTPDYLQACADINSGYNPGNHIQGSQAPRTGDSMGGVIASNPGTQGGTSSEYFLHEFSYPLVAGKSYQVEFYISLADKLKYACNGIGAYFTNNYNSLIGSGKPNYDQFKPQVPATFPTAYQTDKTGWTKISGTYTPSVSGVRWMVIGNFRPDNRLMLSSPDPGTLQSYYYIDDVSVVETAGPASNVVLYLDAYEVPNRFTLYNSSGVTVASTGWVGFANYPGPWGGSLSNSGFPRTVSTPVGSSGSFILRVETSPPADITDAWSATWTCN